jgi:peptidoglycan/LPS O-acetylase OafA/YrhL
VITVFLQALLVLLLGAGIAYYEAPKLKQQHLNRELIVFSCFLLFGVILALAMVFNLPIPNPTRAIEYVFDPLVRLLYPI